MPPDGVAVHPGDRYLMAPMQYCKTSLSDGDGQHPRGGGGGVVACDAEAYRVVAPAMHPATNSRQPGSRYVRDVGVEERLVASKRSTHHNDRTTNMRMHVTTAQRG
jgi:hypothetical protein